MTFFGRNVGAEMVLNPARLTISAIPPYYALWGFECLNMAKLGAIPLALAYALEVQYHPYKRGISAILARYHMKTRRRARDVPSAILSRKGIARY